MTSFNIFLNNFHFIRPLWLLAIFALFLIIWLMKKHRFYQSPWQQFLPNHLSRILVEKSSSNNGNNKAISNQIFLIKPFIIGLLTIIALAGPAWEKLPQPVYQTERGSVLIMDMSYSMYSTDVKPNRLTRSRFKAVDLLNKINEGDTGLIAYAGDAFIISPLTQDIKNIELLLPSLTPEIMPELGANPLAALTLAHEMLKNAGHLNGDIYWFTDDVDNEELSDIYDWSSKYGHQLNVLGVGSENGAPISLPSGELLKDNKGAIVVPRLPSQKLKSVAKRGQGIYQTITNDDSDIDKLISKDTMAELNNDKKQQSQQSGDQWQEQGAWLLILALPLMLGYFRRGSTLLILPVSCIPLLFLLTLTLSSPAVFAVETPAKSTKQNSQKLDTSQVPTLENTSNSFWNNMWQTNDQQAQEHYNQENYQGAASQFEHSQWQGSAHYKAGNYQEALEAFQQGEHANSANSLYNQGNALAQLQQYDKAIESYENALKKNPDLHDAKDNIEKIKQLQKDQEQQQQQSDESNKDQPENEDQNKDQQKQNSQDSQSQDQQSKDQQNQSEQQESDNAQQQNSENDPEQNKEEQTKSQNTEKEQSDKDQKNEHQNKEQQDKQNEQGEEKTPAQIAAEQQAKETDQKHQQLLNKVTDDPYLLLRNKMQLEYQKRKQESSSQGVKKKW